MINVLFDIISQYHVMIKNLLEKKYARILSYYLRQNLAMLSLISNTRQKNPVVTDFAKVKTVVD